MSVIVAKTGGRPSVGTRCNRQSGGTKLATKCCRNGSR